MTAPRNIKPELPTTTACLTYRLLFFYTAETSELCTLLLAQSKRPSWNVESCCSRAYARLARIWRKRAHRSVTLTSTTPKHKTSHAGGRACARRRNCRNEVE